MLDGDNVVPCSLLGRRYGSAVLEDFCLPFLRDNGADVLMAEIGREWTNDRTAYEVVVSAATGKRRRCVA